ncbi:DedA family protein [Nocardioidaceae bacterium SCSIO 66511]|nr:DedA family protein [Nocardioidaceae bacterium SCSIO 66511]
MTEWLASLTDGFGPLVLGFAALFAFAESGLGLGSFLPGESVILALAVGMDEWQQKALLLGAVAVGASTGDHAGYALGRHLGGRLRETRAVRRLGVEHWDRAVGFVRRHGASAVILSRLLPVVRTLVPAIAGVSGLRYRRFLAASLVGSLLWASLWVGAGAAARWAYAALADSLGSAWIAFGVGVVAVIALLVRRGVTRSRRRRLSATHA